MRLLLDTAVLIYAVESPEKLSRRAASTLKKAKNVLELSPVSLAEIAIKAALGKLQLSVGTLRQALKELDIRILPHIADHAFELFELPLYHSDPFDRQIIAQALCERIPVITPDEKFRLYPGLKIVW